MYTIMRYAFAKICREALGNLKPICTKPICTHDTPQYLQINWRHKQCREMWTLSSQQDFCCSPCALSYPFTGCFYQHFNWSNGKRLSLIWKDEM